MVLERCRFELESSCKLWTLLLGLGVTVAALRMVAGFRAETSEVVTTDAVAATSFKGTTADLTGFVGLGVGAFVGGGLTGSAADAVASSATGASLGGTLISNSVGLASTGTGGSTTLGLGSSFDATTIGSGFVVSAAGGGSSTVGGAGGGSCSVASADLTSTVGEADTGFAGSFGLGGAMAPGAASSVFNGVAALMGLLFLRGVCLVRGEEILGESAGFAVLGDVVSTDSDLVGLGVSGLLMVGGVLGEADFSGNLSGVDGVAGGLRGDCVGRGVTTVFGCWLGEGVVGGGGAEMVLTGVMVVLLGTLGWLDLGSTGVDGDAADLAMGEATVAGCVLTTSVFCEDISRSRAILAFAF